MLALKYFKKKARELGVGRMKFYAGVNGLKNKQTNKQNKTKQKNPWHSKFLQSQLTRPGHNFASS